MVQTGGMAAVAVTFSRYFLELTGSRAPDWLPALIALAALTLFNCLGVRSGGAVQSAFMVFKIFAVLALIACGFYAARSPSSAPSSSVEPATHGLLSSFGAALVPVLFAYGGYQTSCFVAGEMRAPRRDLPRALFFGVLAVALLYVGVSYVCVRVLGADGLAHTAAPASAVMRAAFGALGGKLIAFAIALSALGFLAQGILTAPRVYFAMAEDGIFFRSVARVNARTHVPVVAIVLQSVCTMVILLTGRYEQILNYVESVDALFFAITASTLFVFRARQHRQRGEPHARASLLDRRVHPRFAGGRCQHRVPLSA